MDTQQRCILLVEDDDWLLFVLKESLKKVKQEYPLITAHSAREALQKSEGQRLILLITDIRLPGMDGVQLTEKLTEKYDQLVTVWITAYGCYERRHAIEELDVHRCVDKPLKIETFRAIIREALTHAASNLELSGHIHQGDC